MDIQVRSPGANALPDADARYRVTLKDDNIPELHFYFMWARHEDGRDEILNVAFEIGLRVTRTEAEEGRDAETLDAAMVERIGAQYRSYLRLAEQAFLLRVEGLPRAMRELRRRRVAGRLSDEFYRLVAAEYASRHEAGEPATSNIARAFNVDVSTASRWIKTARQKGMIPARARAVE